MEIEFFVGKITPFNYEVATNDGIGMKAKGDQKDQAIFTIDVGGEHNDVEILYKAIDIAYEKYPHLFFKDSDGMVVYNKGNGLFAQTDKNGTDDRGRKFFTVVYKWEGNYVF